VRLPLSVMGLSAAHGGARNVESGYDNLRGFSEVPVTQKSSEPSSEPGQGLASTRYELHGPAATGPRARAWIGWVLGSVSLAIGGGLERTPSARMTYQVRTRSDGRIVHEVPAGSRVEARAAQESIGRALGTLSVTDFEKEYGIKEHPSIDGQSGRP
jgi:hypothetical protein